MPGIGDDEVTGRPLAAILSGEEEQSRNQLHFYLVNTGGRAAEATPNGYLTG